MTEKRLLLFFFLVILSKPRPSLSNRDFLLFFQGIPKALPDQLIDIVPPPNGTCPEFLSREASGRYLEANKRNDTPVSKNYFLDMLHHFNDLQPSPNSLFVCLVFYWLATNILFVPDVLFFRIILRSAEPTKRCETLPEWFIIRINLSFWPSVFLLLKRDIGRLCQL